jgi:hypothetical protein
MEMRFLRAMTTMTILSAMTILSTMTILSAMMMTDVIYSAAVDVMLLYSCAKRDVDGGK